MPSQLQVTSGYLCKVDRVTGRAGYQVQPKWLAFRRARFAIPSKAQNQEFSPLCARTLAPNRDTTKPLVWLKIDFASRFPPRHLQGFEAYPRYIKIKGDTPNALYRNPGTISLFEDTVCLQSN